MSKEKGNPRLDRSLGLFEMTMYGVGTILGAGIYALLGTGAGIAGNAIWLSFIIAAALAGFTGLSYCELSSMVPKEAAEYNYTKKAFNRSLAFVVGWVLLLAMIIAGSAVSLGFAGYFATLLPLPVIPVAMGIIIVLSLINLWGIKESSRFNILATIIETGGLLLVIIVGVLFFNASTDFTFSPMGFYGIMSGAVLMFFAFIGFEDLANMSEETKNAKKNVPRALLLSLAISTILYIAVSVAAVSVVGWETLATSEAPLALILGNTFGPGAAALMSIVALFSTGNTILIVLIVASRMIYGMAKDNALPFTLARVHGTTRTPFIAVLLTMFIATGFLMIGDISFVANITTASVFVAYIFVNASLIALRYKAPEEKRAFRVPVNIGKFPVLATLGLVASIAMLFYSDPLVLSVELALIIAGAVIYKTYSQYRKGFTSQK